MARCLHVAIDAESDRRERRAERRARGDDELNRRYGGDGDDQHLRVDELRPPVGLFLVARSNGDLVGWRGTSNRSVIRHCASARSSASGCDPTYAASGIGLALMTRGRTSARENSGTGGSSSRPDSPNPRRSSLYESTGWTADRRVPGRTCSGIRTRTDSRRTFRRSARRASPSIVPRASRARDRPRAKLDLVAILGRRHRHDGHAARRLRREHAGRGVLQDQTACRRHSESDAAA